MKAMDAHGFQEAVGILGPRPLASLDVSGHLWASVGAGRNRGRPWVSVGVHVRLRESSVGIFLRLWALVGIRRRPWAPVCIDGHQFFKDGHRPWASLGIHGRA